MKKKEKSEKEGLPHGGSGLPPLQLLIEDRSKPALTTCNIFMLMITMLMLMMTMIMLIITINRMLNR